MVCCNEIELHTSQRAQMIDITSRVRCLVETSGIVTGICSVVSLHTTAGVTISENADPDVVADIIKKLESLAPRGDIGYLHGEGNSDSHIKAALTGLSIQVPVRNGSLLLGTWQGIFFCEYDGPRRRKAAVTIVGE